MAAGVTGNQFFLYAGFYGLVMRSLALAGQECLAILYFAGSGADDAVAGANSVRNALVSMVMVCYNEGDRQYSFEYSALYVVMDWLVAAPGEILAQA